MSSDYLAIIGSASPAMMARARAVAAQVSKQTDLSMLIDADGMVVLANPGLPACVLGGDKGVVLGTLFAGTDGGKRLGSFDSICEQAILASDGASLVDDFWGRYVAFLPDEHGDAVHVARDPSGMLPCYYCRVEELTLVTSNAELLVETGLLKPVIDWEYVTRHLLIPVLRPAGTCLAGLTELIRGFRLTIVGRNWSLEQLWSPWKFADPSKQIDDEMEAINRLREVALGCIASWASGYEHVLLGLSGGLDSSIVAAALAQSDVPFSCLTLFTKHPAGDEREFARATAQAVDAPLFEVFEDPAQIDVERCDGAHLPRPIARSFAQSGDREYLHVAKQIGADAFFGGGGGDNIFCYSHSASPIADRLLTGGVLAAARTARDVSLLTQSSFWTAARMGLLRALSRQRGYRWPINQTFLTPFELDELPGLGAHPWLDAPAEALPGKALHIAWILGFQNHLEGFNRERILPKLSPLMSQPLIELCLRIPSWMWCAGGRNRAIARTAFAQDLPSIIINRQSKGTPDGFVVEIMDANRSKIRDMLCGGLLAEQGLLDTKALEQSLAMDHWARDIASFRIMTLVDVEAWARTWSGRTMKAERTDQAPAL
ncbi:asparagine synthase (glutamine-hydrolyzing) [Sphingobium xanthum]|uniref:asparagine synthase-related protein n=1 Tax=Sphingobium xanthum TaxID=1387165 RepID=UPI001C8B2384|nr:asparagine synthase-related protein [Sphingobium xanthum]